MAEEAINTTVAFRLPVSLHTRLVRLAEESGTKKHKLARKWVIRALESVEEEAGAELDVEGVQEAFESLHDSVSDLRTALGRGIAAILQDVAPHRNKEEIRKWVLDRIITPSIQKTQETPEGDDPP